MQLGRLPWKPDDPRYKNKDKTCSVLGCENPFNAKDLCHTHYMRFLRNGFLTYRKDVFTKCKVSSCPDRAGIKGYCRFHQVRHYYGKDLNRPKGNSGPLNIHWNGGTSAYPNHHELKKNRLIVLKKAKYVCQYCGGKADRVHHKDLSKHNHKLENLAASCNACNVKRGTSKFKKMYGKTVAQLAKYIGVSVHEILKLHKRRTLAQYLYVEEHTCLREAEGGHYERF